MKLGEKIKGLNSRYQLLLEIVRFLIIGGLSTLIDYLVAGSVLYLFNPKLYPKFYNVFFGGYQNTTVANVISTGLGALAGLIFNYIFSIIYVYINKGNSKSALGFLMFAFLSFVGLGINMLGMYIFNGLLNCNYWIVKISMTILVLIYNYISKKLIIFNKNKTKEKIKNNAIKIDENN